MTKFTKKASVETPEWIEGLRTLLRPGFIEVSGRVFVVWTRSGAAQCRREYDSKQPETVDENTTNHEHFCFFDGTTVEGVHRNYEMAAVVRMAWADILAQRFPDRRFRLFVSNEYTVDDESEEVEVSDDLGVDTVLRLWSIDPRTSEDFDACFHPDETEPDKVLWLEFQEKGLQTLRHILDVIKQGSSHPEYREALRRQQRSHAKLTT